ncbi:uncharacterized protein LOC111679212 isoform X1 [Lucilia cuprina]|uniref:uncharacterized protein LOC111679212 isoform X1 n=1 Tax=Lucilia cuprina TaxID=7375 RepID=UPI001F056E03|nr:uncharacterized protein LOC111679212 isoform X1 [Lucilia cuprina]
MTTFKGQNFWIYFDSTPEPNKVKCKLCNSTLISKRSFNLRKHLKMLHQLEFRPTKRIYTKTPRKPVAPVTSIDLENASSSFKYDEHNSLENRTAEGGNNFSDLNATTLGSNETLSRDSFSILPTTRIVPDTIKVKVEEEDFEHDMTTEKEAGTTFEGNNSEDETIYNIAQNAALQNLPTQHSQRDNFAEPSSIRPNKLGSSSFNDSYPFTFKEPRRKKKKTAVPSLDNKQTMPLDDPLDDNTSSSKTDYFEQWANKKKQLLEIEMLEMRNYKFKLELWEKEQQLTVANSKFTKDIKLKSAEE